MQTEIFLQATTIIDSAHTLLHDQNLNSRQREALEAIAAAADDFLRRYETSHGLPTKEFYVDARYQSGKSLTPVYGYAELLLTDLLGMLNARQQAWVEDILLRARALYKAILSETSEFASV